MNATRASPRAVKKRAKAGGIKTAARATAKPAGRQARKAIVVTEDQRRHLIEDAAFFRAERYRKAEPGKCREEDRCAAEAELEAVIKRNQPR